MASKSHPFGTPSAWSISKEDPIWQPPSPGMHATQSSGQDLDLHMGWDRFEKLVLAVAKGKIGASTVEYRRYGTQGQTQHGIDIACREPDGRYSVVQCKEYQNFTPGDLRKAVETFDAGDLKFKGEVHQFIVAVSCSTQATQIADELHDLQEEYPDFQIDLWGSEQLNDELRQRPHIVTRFWSLQTAEWFCPDAPPAAEPLPNPDRLTQAHRVLAGPLKTDDVAPRLAAADQNMTSAPSEAATVYEELATELDTAGFRAHAQVLRRKQLQALIAAGAAEEATALACHLAAVSIHNADPEQAQSDEVWLAKHAGVGLGTLLPGPSAATATPKMKHHATLIDTATSSYLDPFGDLSALRAELTNTQIGCDSVPEQPLLVLLLAELMLIDEADQLETVDDLLQNAIDQATRTQLSDVPNDVVLRLRLIRAEYDQDERAALIQSAGRHQLTDLEHAALVHARAARWYTLSGNPDQALDHWYHAINDGIHAHLTNDAAQWMASIQRLKIAYGVRIEQEHLLVQALRDSHGKRLLHRYRDLRDHALTMHAAGKPNRAVPSARRWLADSIVTGRWSDERQALEFLGDVYRSATEPDRAARYYQRAGATTKLSDLIREVGDHRLPCEPLDGAPSWELQARFQTLARQADLIDDATAQQLLKRTTELTHRRLADGLRDKLTASIVTAACALAARGTIDQAQAILDLMAGDVPRGPNASRPSDKAHTRACTEIIKAHPSLTTQAMSRLIDLAAGKVNEAFTALGAAGIVGVLRGETNAQPQGTAHVDSIPVTSEDRAMLKGRIEELIPKSPNAVRLLQKIEPHSPLLRPAAEATLTHIHQQAEPNPPANAVVTTTEDVLLIRALSEDKQQSCLKTLLFIADRPHEPAEQRRAALIGASHLIDLQPSETRAEAFEQSRNYVQGETGDSAVDAQLTGLPASWDPAQVDEDTPSLRGAGLKLAFAAADTDEQYTWIRDQAVALLSSSDTSDIKTAAHVLHSLPSGITDGLDPRLLSNHRHAPVRQLAATLSTRNLDAYEGTATRLAHDPALGVRRELAQSLTHADSPTEAVERLRQILQHDARHTVRRELTEL